MAEDRRDPSEADASGRVLRFRRRGAVNPRLPGNSSGRPVDPDDAPIDDLARYEQMDAGYYRHRMTMNVIAVVVVALLVGAGVWIADTIADMERDQDCVMQGRANCATITVPEPRNRQ